MSLENSLVPMQSEINEYRRKLDEHGAKAKIAGVTGIVFAGVACVFPPAIAGAVVAAEETARHTIALDIEVIRFHTKYPGLDKK